MPEAGREPQPVATAHARSEGLRHFAGRYAVIGVWLLMIAFYGVVEPKLFLTKASLQTILSSQQPLVFMTMALLCTICVGEFVDLSVPAVFGLAATVLPVLVVNHHWNVWAASVAAIASALAVGFVNAFLVVKVGVNTIVVTLGMSTFLLGISLWISSLNTISGLPTGFGKIALYDVGGLPVSFYYGVILVAGFAYVLAYTPLGRHMRFVGASREVSRLSGVRVDRIRFGSFVVSSLLCGVGAVIAVAALGGYNATTSDSFLLPTFAAVFLSTAIIEPGRFNPIGTFLGIYFLETGILGLQLLGLEAWVSPVFYGGVLIAAVTISTVLHKRAT
ncbi:MAG TPA: ABC transporter permease [Actinomycetes bacterium]|nr:ABC transporter permease [Actinomycetes bacterium]